MLLTPTVPAPSALQRLDLDQYNKLCKQVSVIAVNNDTSPIQAGFQLGVQAVLQKLREGWVIGA